MKVLIVLCALVIAANANPAFRALRARASGLGGGGTPPPMPGLAPQPASPPQQQPAYQQPAAAPQQPAAFQPQAAPQQPAPFPQQFFAGRPYQNTFGRPPMQGYQPQYQPSNMYGQYQPQPQFGRFPQA